MICPERDFRENLTDYEFWVNVLDSINGPSIEEFEPDINDLELDEVNFRLHNPCPLCKSIGACYYDSEGRPLIHVIEESEDDLPD